MKKVLFLIQNYDMPSSRVRVLNLVDKIKEKGYEVTVIKYPKKLGDKVLLFKSLAHFDIVYLQKKLPSPIDAYILGKLSKKFIFDFDDSIYLKHESTGKEKSFSTQLKFKSMIKNAHLIVAGNKILAEYASQFNNNIEIVPSVLEVDVPKRDYSIKNDKFIVGWVGGNINLTQLELLGDVFRKLSKELPLEVRVISGKAPNIDGIDLKFVQWDVDTQEAEIAKFDCGVMPLPDSPHARGKCAYKAIQYMAAGVVPVVSDVGVNKDVVLHNQTGLVAESIDDFYTELKYLYNNPKRKNEMGLASDKRATKHFSTESAVEKLHNIFK